MGIFIDGFGISGYRSFGKNVQRVGPLSKINIFAGQNNSGKSNILNYLIHQYGANLKSIQTHSKQSRLNDLDLPMRNWDGITRIDIGIAHNGETYNNLLGKPSVKGELAKSLEALLKSDVLCRRTNVTWLPFEASLNQGFSLNKETLDQLATTNPLNNNQWQVLWATMTSQGGGGLKSHWIPQTLEKIIELLTLPIFSIIPSVRRYSHDTTDGESCPREVVNGLCHGFTDGNGFGCARGD